MKRLPRSVGCPVELAVDLLAGKWKPVILARLKERSLRYSELRRLIPQITDKVLTQRLGDLQTQGLVARDQEAGAYRLTPDGEALRPLLQSLYDWGVTQAKAHNVEVAAGI